MLPFVCTIVRLYKEASSLWIDLEGFLLFLNAACDLVNWE